MEERNLRKERIGLVVSNKMENPSRLPFILKKNIRSTENS